VVPSTRRRVLGDPDDLLQLGCRFRRTAPQEGVDGDDAAGDEPQVLLDSTNRETWPTLSPDGSFLAHVSNESGRREVYITGFPSAEGRWQVSIDGGEVPQWRPDGDAVYFEWGRRVFKVEIARRGSGLRTSSPSVLLDGREHGLLPWDGFHVTDDVARVVTVRAVEDEDTEKPPPGIHVVENWLRAFGG